MKTKGLKVVFVGGGSPRVVPIMRAAFEQPGVFDGGAVRLVDRNLPRAEAVGRMLQRCPEYQRVACPVTWGTDLERALEGADVLYVTMAVGGLATTMYSRDVSMARGFLSSDNVSLSGAMLALTAGPAILGFARLMERQCPQAQMLVFANPVAVFSGMVNNHTRIRALGICGGFANHKWDITRLLYGEDELRDEYDVDVAGINHLSFILRGTCARGDLYTALARRLAQPFRPPRYKPWMSAVSRRHITFALRKLAAMQRRYGSMIFSTEGDGMAHLYYEEMVGAELARWKPTSASQIAREVRRIEAARAADDARFAGYVNAPLDAAFWAQQPHENNRVAKSPNEISLTIFRALAGVAPAKIAASAPGRGAVAGFKDRTVLEYSQVLDRRGARPVPGLAVPDCFHGLITSLATHQTLLGDAIATEDPRVLADALFAYPVQFNTAAARVTARELLAVHKAEIPAVFQKTRDWLK